MGRNSQYVRFVLYHTIWYRQWVAIRNTFRYIPYSLVSPMGRNSQYVSLYTIQSGIANGSQFAIRFVIYHTVWYRQWVAIRNTFRYIPYSLVSPMGRNSQYVSLYTIQSGIAYESQFAIRFVLIYHTVWYRLWVAIRNTFRYIPYSLVSPMSRNSQYVSYLYTIQSGIAYGSQFAIRFVVYHTV